MIQLKVSNSQWQPICSSRPVYLLLTALLYRRCSTASTTPAPPSSNAPSSSAKSVTPE